MNTNTETPEHRLSNLLMENTNNIPEQSYIQMQNCLAEINRNSNLMENVNNIPEQSYQMQNFLAEINDDRIFTELDFKKF